VDDKSGPNQDQLGSDGIGDTPHSIPGNLDHYPLMKPYGGAHDIGITDVTTSKTVVGQGYNVDISTTILNYGIYTENLNIAVYANTTTIASQNVTLTSRNSTTLAFTWNTSGFVKGNYTISAYAWPVLGETYTTDNKIDRTILVTLPGDVNGDKDVDGKDISIIAKYFGKPASVYPNADVNCDGDIDGKDLSIAAKNFGKSWA